jgi:hypothetical protein
VAVITTTFVDGADLMARALGVAGYRFAIIEHPISSASGPDLAGKAAATLAQAEALLAP